jgi:hypothetical protein
MCGAFAAAPSLLRFPGALTHAMLPAVAHCICDFGWMCDAHPDQPRGHQGCEDGDGVPCARSDCPFWQQRTPHDTPPAYMFRTGAPKTPLTE